MERLKFYADNADRSQKNKLFTFKIDSAISLGDSLLRFSKKFDLIRAAWYEFINEDTGEVENRRIDLDFFYQAAYYKDYKDTTDLIKFID